MQQSPDEHAARLAALQPYWRPRGRPAGLTEEERRALASDTMPASALAAGRKSAARTAKIALAVAAIGFVVAASGGAILLMGGGVDAGPGWPLVFGGGLLLLPSLLFALGSAVTMRQYRPTPLRRITDRVVDVRRVQRLLGRRTRQIQPLEIRLAGGVAIEVPLDADTLGQTFVPGGVYRFWYLPATTHTYDTLIYADLP